MNHSAVWQSDMKKGWSRVKRHSIDRYSYTRKAREFSELNSPIFHIPWNLVYAIKTSNEHVYWLCGLKFLLDWNVIYPVLSILS